MNQARIGFWFVIFALLFGIMTQPFGSFALAQSAAHQANAKSAITQPINVNQASLEELQKVKGIGPVLAERIMNYRSANGNFKSVDQMKEVKGISESKLAKIKEQITL